jgi:acyl dehydratase
VPIGEFAVDETNAIIYSECARIFNPIHTDPRVAKAAGLPSTVLHGTETLARAVSLITSRLPGTPATVEALSCRFTGMVTPGADLKVRASREYHGVVHFDVIAADGSALISAGCLHTCPNR